MCFDLTTHSQMLSYEDCTIRVALDQSLIVFSITPIRRFRL